HPAPTRPRASLTPPARPPSPPAPRPQPFSAECGKPAEKGNPGPLPRKKREAVCRGTLLYDGGRRIGIGKCVRKIRRKPLDASRRVEVHPWTPTSGPARSGPADKPERRDRC